MTLNTNSMLSLSFSEFEYELAVSIFIGTSKISSLNEIYKHDIINFISRNHTQQYHVLNNSLLGEMILFILDNKESFNNYDIEYFIVNGFKLIKTEQISNIAKHGLFIFTEKILLKLIENNIQILEYFVDDKMKNIDLNMIKLSQNANEEQSSSGSRKKGKKKRNKKEKTIKKRLKNF